MAATKNPRPGPEPDGDNPHPAHKSAEHHAHKRQIPDVPRRWVLASLAAAAVGTAFRANIAAGYLLTEQRQFTITTPNNAANQAAAVSFPGAAWYLLGGFGVSYRDCGRKLAALQPAMNQRAPASYIGYSNDGIDIAQLFIAIQRDAYVRKIHTAYLYGDSFGGMVAAVLAPLLEQNGIHVRLIVMGSSPSNVRDVLDPGKEYISLAGTIVPYLGILGRLAVGVWNGLANPNGQGMYEAARSGVRSSLDDGHNSLILDTTQATFLEAFPAQYDGGIARTTGIGLLYDPQDFIVNAPLAIEGWKALLPKNPSFEYDIPHTGHASPEIYPDVYQTALGVLQDVLAPLPRVTKPIQPIF
jgi:pimeloyl-ACP methyl ester carboxylesterase